MRVIISQIWEGLVVVWPALAVGWMKLCPIVCHSSGWLPLKQQRVQLMSVVIMSKENS